MWLKQYENDAIWRYEMKRFLQNNVLLKVYFHKFLNIVHILFDILYTKPALFSRRFFFYKFSFSFMSFFFKLCQNSIRWPFNSSSLICNVSSMIKWLGASGAVGFHSTCIPSYLGLLKKKKKWRNHLNGFSLTKAWRLDTLHPMKCRY